MFSFQNAWPTKRKAVYTLVLSTYLFISSWHVRIGSDHNITCVLFKSTSLILVNLQAVAGGKKCFFRPVNFTSYRLIRRTLNL